MSNKDTTADEALLPLCCPKCGGELGNPSAGRFTCSYCGTSFLPREVFAGKRVDLTAVYEQAFAAADEGDYDRAHEYFKRILETDTGEYQAWVGKGIAGAYARFNETGKIKAGETLSCVDMAVARYDGDDRTAFQRRLADRVGALAVDLTWRVQEDPVYDEGILRALLDLLAYWEKRGTEELKCWTATVDAAETPVQHETRGFDGCTYYITRYPFEPIAREYREKIRAKYAPPVKGTPAPPPEVSIPRQSTGTDLVTVAIVGFALALAGMVLLGIILALVDCSYY